MISTLPFVQSVADCANHTTTVLPYLPQISEFPVALLNLLRKDPALVNQLYTGTNPLVFAFLFSLFLVPIFILVSEANKNYSQVDRVWSILPTIYNAHYAYWGHIHGLDTGRVDLLLAASLLWSTRLTFNYWRKGGYTVGSEDYRWEILRKYISPPLFFVFNVLFIALAQSVLLFLVTTPAYVLLLLNHLSSSSSTIANTDVIDFAFVAALVVLNVLIFTADQQQWDYQTTKYKYKETAKVPSNSKFTPEDLDRGFLIHGLFAWSRHPNFAGEQAFWVTIYLWASWKAQTLLNWTFIGTFSYLCLFQASTLFTEWVTSSKYPEYKDYQEQVGKFLPGKFYPPSFGPANPQAFKSTPGQKAIGNADVDAQVKNEEDKEQAKKRYNLR